MKYEILVKSDFAILSSANANIIFMRITSKFREEIEYENGNLGSSEKIKLKEKSRIEKSSEKNAWILEVYWSMRRSHLVP